MATKKITRKQTMALPHIIIDAGPGCGKTTTMVAGLNLLKGKKPSWYADATDEQKAIWKAMEGSYYDIGFQAFNKSIATEIQAKVPKDVKASTFHSYGYRVLKEAGYKMKASGDNDKYVVRGLMGFDKDDRLKKEDWEMINATAKVIGLLKNNLLEATKENVLAVAEAQEIEINGNLGDIVSLSEKAMSQALQIEPGKFSYISFDDMLWLPIALDLDMSEMKFDLLISDESQDLNALQHQMVIKSGSRLIIVGDPRQAIYGFRGADASSMETLQGLLSKTKRGVQVMTLQTSFRLPKSGVRNVQSFAPNLKALDSAGEGEIKQSDLSTTDFTSGSLVVSRINGNIFSLAFKLLKQGRKVRIQGRDFGSMLTNIIKNNCSMDDKNDVVLSHLEMYDAKEQSRLSKKQFSEKLIDTHNEKMSCLYSMIEGCDTAKDMIETIDQLFNNKIPRSEVVLLSTVHRAKGLEAGTVYFLEPELCPHPMATTKAAKAQEYNIKFVAETRHKETLVYVNDDNAEVETAQTASRMDKD